MSCDQVIDSYDGSKDYNYTIIVPEEYVGQAFRMGAIARDICKAKFYLEAEYAGGTSIDITAKIYACTGTPGVDGVPTGAALASSDTIRYTENQAAGWEEFIFSIPYTLLANTNYCIVLECTAIVDLIFGIYISFDSTSPTHSGNYFDDYDGYQADKDCNFFIYCEAPTQHEVVSISSRVYMSQELSSDITQSQGISSNIRQSISISSTVELE